MLTTFKTIHLDELYLSHTSRLLASFGILGGLTMLLDMHVPGSTHPFNNHITSCCRKLSNSIVGLLLEQLETLPIMAIISWGWAIPSQDVLQAVSLLISNSCTKSRIHTHLHTYNCKYAFLEIPASRMHQVAPSLVKHIAAAVGQCTTSHVLLWRARGKQQVVFAGIRSYLCGTPTTIYW